MVKILTSVIAGYRFEYPPKSFLPELPFELVKHFYYRLFRLAFKLEDKLISRLSFGKYKQ